MHPRHFLLAAALAATGAAAQTPAAPAAPGTPSTAATADCPRAADVTYVHLVGLWRAEFQGLWQGATLLLEKHPEYEGSLSGAANRNGERSLLAGDVEQGGFTMEESYDGKRVSAVWTGDIVEGSCGKEIRGTWQEETDPPKPHAFVLRKIGS